MQVKARMMVPPEVREKFKSSVIVSEKPLPGGTGFKNLSGGSDEGVRFYVYSRSPELFGEPGPSPKYLGDITVEAGSVKDLVGDKGAWLKKMGAGDDDRVADVNFFYPLEEVETEFWEHGMGGKALDLLLEKLSEKFDWAMFFSPRPRMAELLRSRDFAQDDDTWLKKL